jgi:hypothetical protein
LRNTPSISFFSLYDVRLLLSERPWLLMQQLYLVAGEPSAQQDAILLSLVAIVTH